MQLSSVTISLGGDIRNTVEKPDVTPAEISILNHIHGEGAVKNIVPLTMDKRPHKVEKERLIEQYKRLKETIDGMYPGFDPKLPIYLKDIEIDIDAVDGELEMAKPEEVVASPKRKGRASKAKAAPIEEGISDEELEALTAPDETD